MSDTEFDPTLPTDEIENKTDAEAEIAPVEGEGEAAEFPAGADADAETDAAQSEAEEPLADAPAVDAGEHEAEALVAPDADEVSAQAEAEADAPAAEGDAKQEAAPVADDGNVVHPEDMQAPLAEASSIAPALPSDSTGPATAEAGDVDGQADTGDEAAEGDEAQKPAPATPAPLDTIRAEAQGSADGEADPSAGIVPQPKAEDAIAERPLSGIASEENRGAVDAMPAAAQQHMGQWVKGVHEAEPAEGGQLPTTADLPGTSMDATGVGTYAKGGVTQADKALEAKAEDGDEAAQEIVDNGGGSGTPAEAGSDSDADAEMSDDGFEGDDSLNLGEGSDDQSGDDDGYFGEPQVQHGPLVDVAGDAIDALKEAAEQAALAQNHFQNVPLAVLDVQHKDMLVDVRVVLGDLLRLAARLFERIER